VQIGNFRLEITNFRPKITNFRPETTNFRPKITNFRPKITNFRPKITNLRPKINSFQAFLVNFQALFFVEAKHFSPRRRRLCCMGNRTSCPDATRQVTEPKNTTPVVATIRGCPSQLKDFHRGTIIYWCFPKRKNIISIQTR
jgi:hypothetical protein